MHDLPNSGNVCHNFDGADALGVDFNLQSRAMLGLLCANRYHGFTFTHVGHGDHVPRRVANQLAITPLQSRILAPIHPTNLTPFVRLKTIVFGLIL